MNMTWGLAETLVGLPPYPSWHLVEEYQRALLPLSLGGGHQGPKGLFSLYLFFHASLTFAAQKRVLSKERPSAGLLCL